MTVFVEKASSGWLLAPMRGSGIGPVVGVVEELHLSKVSPHGEGFVGELERVWGLVVLSDHLHNCPEITRGLQPYPRVRKRGYRLRPLTSPTSYAVFNSKGIAW